MKIRDCRMYIEDILSSMNRIEKYVNGLEYEDFIQNDMAVDAVIRNLEIIGEASKNVPENVRSQYPDVPWKRMIGLRNIVIHDYFGVDLSIVWRIVTKNIPAAKIQVEKILNDL